jgi:hypothetical protein
MEKSMKSSVAMAAQGKPAQPESPVISLVQAVLALRSQTKNGQSIPPEISERIQGLRGILDWKATSVRNGGDWRRGAASQTISSNGSEARWRRNHVNNNSTTSLSSAGSATPPPTQNRTPHLISPPTGRYQSRFKNSSEPLEEKILNRIIRLKLNKFGVPTYNEIRDFLFQILGQESVSAEDGSSVSTNEGQVAEFICDFMRMVFRKAAAEEIYCPLYAKLLAEIGAKHSCIFEEMNNLYKNYLEIFEEEQIQKSASAADLGNVAAMEQRNVEKKYRQGYSQFIAELTALEILSLDSLSILWQKLMSCMETTARNSEKKALVDEYVDCLLRMSRVLKGRSGTFFSGVRQRLWNENKTQLSDFIHVRDSTYSGLSPKSRFLLMDIQDILQST